MSKLEELKGRKRKRAYDEKKSDLQFWLADEPFRAVFANAQRLAGYNNARRDQAFYYASLYDDAELATMLQGSNALELGIPQTMTQNIVRPQVRTYVNKVAKNRPLPMALTTGEPFGAQRRAEAVTKFAEGVLDTVGFWGTRKLRIRDAAIWGSGFARNYRVGRKLFHKRALPGEIMVDPRDGYYGKPTTIIIRHHVDRAKLIAEHPNFEKEILEADDRLADDDLWISWDNKTTSDVVVVLEQIHLPSLFEDDDEKGSGDGAYVKCISNATLINDEYVRDYHPLSKNDFEKPVIGYFGEGMVRQLAGVQFESNMVGLRLQENGFMTGSYVWSQDGTGIAVDTLDNGSMSVIRSLTKPEFFTPAPWHPQFMQYHESLLTRRPGEITGLSTFATRGELPPGLEGGSGIAIQHARDEGSENLWLQGDEDGEDVINTMWQLLDLMEEIHEEVKGTGKKYIVRVDKSKDGRTAIEDMDYAAIRQDRKDMTLRVFPTNYLATTPSDRWQQVSEMAEKGLFGQDEVLALLNFPDIKRILNLKNAPRRVVERIIERLLDPDFKGTIVPESIMNLDLCVAIGALAYLEAKWIDEAPDDLCDRVLTFALQARKKRDEAQPATGAGPQPGAQDPMALPGEEMPLEPAVNVPGMPAPLPDEGVDPALALAPPGVELPPPGAI